MCNTTPRLVSISVSTNSASNMSSHSKILEQVLKFITIEILAPYDFSNPYLNKHKIHKNSLLRIKETTPEGNWSMTAHEVDTNTPAAACVDINQECGIVHRVSQRNYKDINCNCTKT